MEKFRIEGGRKLSGTVRVNGSKNAALPVMAASLAVRGQVTLHRIPSLLDVLTMEQLLVSLGANVTHRHPGSLVIDSQDTARAVASWEFVRKMRAGVCVLGPLLSRFGRACVSLPGGCQIGQRPIDLHLRGLAALGADLRLEGGYVVAECGRLQGTELNMAGPGGSTVTGTCNVLVAAATAAGSTIIRSAACEPEVRDLGRFLNAAGARISGLGTSVIEIHGVDELHTAEYSIISDRIEAATLALAAAITQGDVLIQDAPVEDMGCVIRTLQEMGVQTQQSDSGIRVRSGTQHHPLTLMATPFPGLPTDTQAQFTAFLALVPGTSVVADRVFPERFMHVPELVRLGADIHVAAGAAVIRGVNGYRGAAVTASDLRASAALVLAALAAEGTSEVHRVHHLDRGYSAFECRLNQLGASVIRLPDPEESSAPLWHPPTPHFLQNLGQPVVRRNES